MIVKYVRKKKSRKPFGAFVAEKHDGKFFIGWAKCNRKDTFNKEVAKKMAKGRIEAQIDGRSVKIPHSLCKQAKQFEERCKKYFKDCEPVEKVENLIADPPVKV